MNDANGSAVGLELAEFVCDLSLRDLPQAVVQHTKWLVLDLLGVSIMGERHPAAESLKRYVADQVPPGRASILQRAATAPASWAAFANASYAQIHDGNDGHTVAGVYGGFSHPGRIVVPVALAAAEELGASSEDVLAAVVAGYEVMCRIRGKAPKPPAGGYGAAAVASRIQRLTPSKMLHAMGMAGHLEPKRVQYLSGTDINHLTSGYLARLGIECAHLAQVGASGPAIYDDRSLTTRYVTKGLGTTYEILHTYTKPYPCCRETHAAVDAVLALRSTEIDPLRDIQEVRVYQPSMGMYVEGPCISKISSHKTCQFSIAYVLAVALLDGVVHEQQFARKRIADEDVHALMSRIRLIADDEMDSLRGVQTTDLAAPRPAKVEITLASGDVRTKTVLYPLGHPKNPLTENQRIEKFVLEAEPTLGEGRTHEVISAVQGFDEGTPGELMAILRQNR